MTPLDFPNLPRRVVINHEGKSADYRSGFDAIKPDEGLRPLDEAVVRQLKTN